MERPRDFDEPPDHDAPQYDVTKAPAPADVPAPPAPRPRQTGLWFVVAALLVMLGTTFHFLLTRTPGASGPSAVIEAVEPPATPPAPLGADVASIDLPPLDQSDALVRTLVAALSSHPRILAWLAPSDRIRNFVVVVDNVARGQTPAGHLRTLRPPGRFEALDDEEALVIPPPTYQRYAQLAGAVQSVDAAGAARLYSTLKPRIEEAYRALGNQEPFDRALERAIVALLEAPALEGDVRLVPKGGVFAFADPRLERLSAAQKQLVRAGPGNLGVIQAKLREIASALGIPAARLPESPAAG